MVLCCRDKPRLLFFDIKQCATVVSISELLAGEVDTNTIFTCPTQQVTLNQLMPLTALHDLCMLIKQPTLAVERREEKREEGYKGLHSGLAIAGLTIMHELWYIMACMYRCRLL